MTSEAKIASDYMLGVSIVICTYNGTARLPQTLAHLAAQQVGDDVQWEVIVIDNASTDDTARVAEASWSDVTVAPLRVVHETRLGLSYARRRGFDEARYEIVGLVDDDNLVCPDWVRLVSEIMTAHPEAGACGGWSDAICEVEPPWWFENHKIMYAVGPEMPNKDRASERAIMWGAGFAVRRRAWQELVRRGFESRLTDRQGKALVGGGDTELSLALRLMGWRLRYDPRLRLQHVISPARLTWSHLRRLHRGDGTASVGLDPYFAATSRGTDHEIPRYKSTWAWQVAATCKFMLRRPHKLFSMLFSPREGDRDILWIDHCRGRLRRLLQVRGGYDRSFDDVERMLTAYPREHIVRTTNDQSKDILAGGHR